MKPNVKIGSFTWVIRRKMENILSVEETKTRLICELSTVTGFKYLKSGILKKTVKDIVFEINFFSSKWNASGQSIEVNADLRIIYKNTENYQLTM